MNLNSVVSHQGISRSKVTFPYQKSSKYRQCLQSNVAVHGYLSSKYGTVTGNQWVNISVVQTAVGIKVQAIQIS